ncbi:MAG: hypothetical protein A2204_05355 [Elusimicrobia bacterium RIFOXYA1_FULL_47_7]|nr:MAG: hypothetical protein A2278_00790 [Elusimicrobia bacterium RIFOXYA12_FULL_49_49]OGS09868.1 MAG: hypothetical protein A2204_05355 [Elusimicrobia bacterium RIFOXYA1_FULL_47_7]OGS10648.1 MAG: hypothetical protein A2386_00660 [Elusimicrobia bacterium RIFOXYB1_FULL_48_9]OGS15074.1 MAG: hypothetical protein A2251_00250 [Elusimicrobia bacterium RIFOXYA2_FULL_47_53]OGS29412.1 MAG: hypothetical protein A2323_00535 [Elusimicrobia bacterium RIFOXYB2_FULL_46_23]
MFCLGGQKSAVILISRRERRISFAGKGYDDIKKSVIHGIAGGNPVPDEAISVKSNRLKGKIV